MLGNPFARLLHQRQQLAEIIYKYSMRLNISSGRMIVGQNHSMR